MVSFKRALVVTFAVSGMALTVARAATLPVGVTWRPAAASADIDAAFKSARAADKPLLLYWGATWCPPCNQLKATLFNRQDFAALSKSFVAVHIDGDRPGAQKLGQRFKVGGYPTLVLFKPDGTEITRLPGEADAEQVLDLLRLGLACGRPASQVLADARAGKTLTASEWRLLAFYSFETDDEQLVAKGEAAAVLAELAVAGGATSDAAGPETATRPWLRAAAASDDGKGLKADEPLRDRLRRVLADPAQVRAHADVIINGAPEIVRMLGDTPRPASPSSQRSSPRCGGWRPTRSCRATTGSRHWSRASSWAGSRGQGASFGPRCPTACCARCATMRRWPTATSPTPMNARR